jgi:alkanesulfonate monooxygenase SsuD/methylene tetrahydromethanopterin reductase-like flavin-dependent oxidoreductase (luciferase family)
MTQPAIAAYRQRFRPSAASAQPHVIVTVGVITADTDAEAQRQADPSRLMMLALRSGRLRPLDAPETAAAHPHLEMARSLPSTQVAGAPERVVAEARAPRRRNRRGRAHDVDRHPRAGGPHPEPVAPRRRLGARGRQRRRPRADRGAVGMMIHSTT